jgi:hypothetical protein
VIAAAMLLALSNPAATMQWHLALERGGSLYSFGVEYRDAATQDEDDRTYPIGTFDATFRGLTKEQLRGNGPVRFEVVRPAGTLTCVGTANGGGADGDFGYQLDASLAGSLAKRGVAGSLSEETQREWLFSGADPFAVLDALASANESVPSIGDLERAFNAGVDADFVRAMSAAGIRPGLYELARLADHGVTTRYVAALERYGYRDLPAGTLLQLADHGVTSRYLAGLAQEGYRVTPDQAVRLIDHGVTLAYIAHLRQNGYANLSVDDLVRLADHGVH